MENPINIILSLPTLLNQHGNPDGAVQDLVEAYRNYFNEYPEPSQLSVWKFITGDFIKIVDGFPTFAEFPIFNLERADYVIVDSTDALIIEAKGWKNLEIIDNRIVKADGKLHLDPCYQLNNYVFKFNYFHSSGLKLKYSGILFLYNNRSYSSDDCQIVHTFDELKSYIEKFRKPEGQDIVEIVRNGHFHVSEDIIDLIIKNKDEILSNASISLLGRGYGLTENQALLVRDVIDAIEKNEDTTFLVKGSSGSGKTLVAVELLLEAFAKKYKVFLAYRNNRLLNTLRQILETRDGKYNLSPNIIFYSTGRGEGIGEDNFPVEKYGSIDLVIYDEAQRMTEAVIKTTNNRSKVKVYFYDENQILIGDEAGTYYNFKKYCNNISEYEFPSVFRISRSYLDFVNKILDGSDPPKLRGYSVRIFDRITDMFEDLTKLKSKGNKIALMCAFTESNGDKKNPKSTKNRRIGYPLPSGLDIYKGSSLDIYWLMDEKTEYPRYWSGIIDPLSRCASVYGSQGFETQYAGLVWGRDLIWRGDWVVNGEPITDRIGNNYSLKETAKKDPRKALRLLRNRYYILLTRAIMGIDIFFEDELTGKHIKSLLGSTESET